MSCLHSRFCFLLIDFLTVHLYNWLVTQSLVNSHSPLLCSVLQYSDGINNEWKKEKIRLVLYRKCSTCTTVRRLAATNQRPASIRYRVLYCWSILLNFLNVSIRLNFYMFIMAARLMQQCVIGSILDFWLTYPIIYPYIYPYFFIANRGQKKYIVVWGQISSNT